MSYPNLPEDMETEGLNLELIWHEVCEELTNIKFKNRTHHNRRTHTAGCPGPLCRKASRDYTGQRFGHTARPRNVLLNAVLMVFWTEAERRIEILEAQKFEKLIS